MSTFSLKSCPGHAVARVLLVTSKSGTGYNMAPPLGLYRLKHYIEQRGAQCEVADLDLLDGEEERYIDNVSAGSYDIVGLSVSHTNMNFDLRTLWRLDAARRRSENKVLLIAGGQEATLNYQQWLNTGLDLIVLGYGEQTLHQLCRLAASGRATKENCTDIPGIAIKEASGGYRINPAAPLTQQSFTDLAYQQMREAEIPFPRYWDKFKDTAAHLNFTSSKFVLENVRLYTSSHCPGGCGFCSSQSFLPQAQQRKLQVFLLSARQVYDLVLHYIERYGAKSFLFSDDDFVIGSQAGLARLEEFCALVRAAKEKGIIAPQIMFNCQAKVADFIRRGDDGADFVRTDLIEKMARAGFHSMGMGVETFSDRLLKAPSINKAGLTRHVIEDVLQALLAGGITPQINIILGIPETTIDDLIATMRCAVTQLLAGCQIAVMPKLMAFPGSPVTEAHRHQLHVEEHIDPITGNKIVNTLFLVPREPRVLYMIEHLEQTFARVVRNMRKKTQRASGNLPKSQLGICYFIAAAELLGDATTAREFTAVAYSVAAGETRSC